MIDEPTPRGLKLVRLLISAAVVLPLFATWAMLMSGKLSAEEVISGSMEPTLQVGDRVVVRHSADETVNTGDIVVVKPQLDDGDPLVKRLVALPGDEIMLYNGLFYVNGRELAVRAGYFPQNLVIPRIVMGEDEYYVLGDNYGQSEDSTAFGPVRREDIVGKVWFRYSPWEARGAVE